MTRRPLFLLQGALAYAVDVVGALAPGVLGHPTPCPKWDVGAVLEHLVTSLGVLGGSRAPHGRAAPLDDPVAAFTTTACLLLARTTTGRRAHTDDSGEDRAAAAGALEIAVHTWDITRACRYDRPLPPIIAADLLELAPRIVPAHLRPGLFAPPVAVAAGTGVGDRLVAFLGRHPGR